jgi:mRNA-degrading endonuclease HigB of HigAB toxin-antitoxin module
MAISTKKRNIIIAQWKTGAYKKSELIAKHKIDRKTLNKFIGDLKPTNAEIVELCTVAENAKSSLKNPHEIKAVEDVVANRLQVYDISNTILKGVEKLVKGGKAQKILADGVIVECDLQAKDYKDLQDAVDKASVTLGINQRFSQSQVNIQNNNQINQLNTIDDFYD